MSGSLLACLVCLLAVSGVTSSLSVCNVKQDGKFKCECRELSHGRISVDCSSNSFLRIPGEGIPTETTKLYLQYNRVRELRTNDFISLVNLRTLNLAYNDLEDIQPNAFRGLASLTNLTLSNNYLARIESNTFSDLVNLTYVDLRNNDIYWIANNAFFFMPNLRTVNLQGMKLQCDCETKLLRDWSLNTGVSLAGVKCSNFIKDRDLIDVPDDQFGDCADPPRQSCTQCSGASSLTECSRSGRSEHCKQGDSCQITSYITSGQQFVESQCQMRSDCVRGLSLNPVRCRNASPNQRCTFCCRGTNCIELVNIQGYTYQTSMAIGFTLRQMFNETLLQTNNKGYHDLSTYILQQMQYVLSNLVDINIKLMHFRPSPSNKTTVTLHTTSVWSLERSNSYIQENIYRILSKAIDDGILDIPIIEESLMVYVIGYCKAEVITSEEGRFQWPDTSLGEQITISCPHPRYKHGKARRACVSVWHEEDLVQLVTWSDPDLTQCAVASNVTDQLKTLVNTPITNGTIRSVITRLQELTSYQMSTTDIQYTSLTLENVMTSHVKVDDDASLGILATYDNLMTSNVDVLQQSQQNFQSVERTLKVLDNFSSILTSIPNKTLTEKQISVGILPPTKVYENDLTFHVSGADSVVFHPGHTSMVVNSSGFNGGDTEAAITVPAPVLNTVTNYNIPVQFVAFKNDSLFRAMNQRSPESLTTTQYSTDDKQHSAAVNSLVMAASFGQLHMENLSKPLVIMYRHRMKDIYGEGGNVDEQHKTALNIISYIGCCISLTALLLTLIAYSISSKLRKDNPSKLLTNLCVALSMVMILFIVVTQRVVWSNTLACKATAGLLHYFLLSTWMWMAVEAFYMYLALIKIFRTYISRFILKCFLFGWGIPAVIVVITVSVRTDNYGQQGDICWLARNPFYGACLAPIALILAANFVIFSLVIHQLRRLSARNDQRSMKRYDIQTQLRGAIAVVILLGLTWVFAIFAVGGASLVFQYLFCIFNSFQGLFIFIFYCVMKKDVKDIWRQKLSDFTTTVTSGDRSNAKSDKFAPSQSGSVQHTTNAIHSPRIRNLLHETTDRSTLTGNSDHSEKVNFTGESLINESET